MKTVLKRLLPTTTFSKLRKLHYAVDERISSLAAYNGFFASLYYALVNRAFYREHCAVLRGRAEYRRSLRLIGNTSVLLRRNTHRLEKGLIMRPRRTVFAEDYIAETVECYVRAVKSGRLCIEEEQWVGDVLRQYFCAVGNTPVIASARERFQSVNKPLTRSELSAPYPHANLPDLSVTFEQFRKLCIRRRSVRWFQKKPVAIEAIKRAVDVASLAPSACNRQAFVFKVAIEPTKAVQLAGLADGTSGYSDNLQCVIAVVGNLDAYPLERDRHLIYIDGSLAAMQLMLALECLGLSTCPINWPDVDIREAAVGKFLGLRACQRTVMLIAVGHADRDGGVPYSQKKGADALIEPI